MNTKSKYLESIVALVKNGLGDQEIARKLGISASLISHYRKRDGFPMNRRKYKPETKNGLIRCRKCRAFKGIKQYSPVKRLPLGVENICHKCRSAQATKRCDELQPYFKRRISMLRYKSKEKPFDLDWQYLLKLFNDAHGLCFYTDIQMNVNAGGRDRSSVSVDKLIPDKGYVKGNVVLCTRRANLIKNDLTIEELKRWMPDWHSRIRRFYNADINNGI